MFSGCEVGHTCRFLKLGGCSGLLDSDRKEVPPCPGTDHAHGAYGMHHVRGQKAACDSCPAPVEHKGHCQEVDTGELPLVLSVSTVIASVNNCS